jgi:hypothetical protein
MFEEYYKSFLQPQGPTSTGEGSPLQKAFADFKKEPSNRLTGNPLVDSLRPVYTPDIVRNRQTIEDRLAYVTLFDGRQILKSRLEDLEYGREVLALHEANETKRRGFIEAWTDVDRWKQNIPIAGHAFGTVLPIRDMLAIKGIMDRLNAGEEVSDEDMLKVQLFIMDQQRMGEASFGGRVGEVTRAMVGFGAQLGIEMWAAGKAGALLTGNPKVAGTAAFVAGSKKLAEGTFKAGVGLSRRAAHKILSRKMQESVAKMLMTAGGKQLVTRGTQFGVGLIGSAYAGTAITGVEVGGLALTNKLLGQDALMSTEAAERYASAAIAGEDLSLRSAKLMALSDKWIENVSEMAGTMGMFEAFLPAGGTNKIVAGWFEKVWGDEARRAELKALRQSGKIYKGATSLAQRMKLAAAVGGASVLDWVSKGGDLGEGLARLAKFGYDGFLEELMEERYGDFIRGFVGLEGEGKGLRNAMRTMIPSREISL